MSEWQAVEMARGQVLFMRFTRGSFAAWMTTLVMMIRDLVRTPAFGIMALFNGFRLTRGGKPWWARLKFLISALFDLPKGQSVTLPSPNSVKR